MAKFLAHFSLLLYRTLLLAVVLALYSFEHEVQRTETSKDKTFNQVVTNV